MKKSKNDTHSYYTHEEIFNVIIDSRNGTVFNNGSMNSSIEYQLDDAVRRPRDAKSMSVSVLKFTCPISFYQINSSNNKLSITMNGNTLIYSLPYGNYIYSTFTTALGLLLPTTFSFSFNTINNRMTITNSTYNFTINPSSMWEVMGFAYNTSYDSFNRVLTMPYTVNFSGIYSFNIHCQEISTRNIDSNTSSISDILASVPINNAQNNIIYYEKKTDDEFILTNQFLDTFTINLIDDIGNYIDLNNQHYNLVLQFRIRFDEERQDRNEFDFYDIMGYELNHPNLT